MDQRKNRSQEEMHGIEITCPDWVKTTTQKVINVLKMQNCFYICIFPYSNINNDRSQWGKIMFNVNDMYTTKMLKGKKSRI